MGNSSSSSTKVINVKPGKSRQKEALSREKTNGIRKENVTIKSEKTPQKTEGKQPDDNKLDTPLNNNTETPLQNRNVEELRDIILSSVTPTGRNSLPNRKLDTQKLQNGTTKIQDSSKITRNESRRTVSSRALALMSVTPSALTTDEIGLRGGVIQNDAYSEDEDEDNEESSDGGEDKSNTLQRTEDIKLDIESPRDENEAHNDNILSQENAHEHVEVFVPQESAIPKVNALVEHFWAANAPDDDLPCWVHGLATISDGCTLVLDLNNNKLKLFDEKYNFCHSVQVSEECQGITSVYKNEVAMTCGSDVIFYYVDKEGFILQQRCFKLNGEGFGISYGHKNFAVTCDITQNKACIRILSDRGKQRYVIKNCYGSTVKMTKYVALDPSKDIVYISDQKNKRIVSMTFEGKELWQLRLDDEPRDVLCMSAYLLVADHRQHQLLQVSYDGAETQTLLTEEDDLWNPELLVFNSNMNHLLISTPENIMVFKIV